MAELSEEFEKGANGPLDVGAVNAHMEKRIGEVKPADKDFTNTDEYKRRWGEVARENLADKYVLEKMQKGKPFGTGDAIRHIDALPNDYSKIKMETGEMENRVFDSTKRPSSSGRMDGPTMGKLAALEGTTDSLKNGVREGLSLEGNAEGAKGLVSAANKEGVKAQDVVNFYGLSQGEKLPDDIAKPLLNAQTELDKKPTAPAAAAKVQAPAAAP